MGVLCRTANDHVTVDGHRRAEAIARNPVRCRQLDDLAPVVGAAVVAFEDEQSAGLRREGYRAHADDRTVAAQRHRPAELARGSRILRTDFLHFGHGLCVEDIGSAFAIHTDLLPGGADEERTSSERH